jgi:hypothetical protein
MVSTVYFRRIRLPRTGLPNCSGSLRNSACAPTQHLWQVRNRLLDAVPGPPFATARLLEGPGGEREESLSGPRGRLRDYSAKVKEAHLLKDGVAWTTGSYTFTVNDKEDKPEQVRGKLACYAWARGHGVEN